MKNFNIRGEEVASLTWWNLLPQEGGTDLRIDVQAPFKALKPNEEARRLGEWLLKAADHAEKQIKLAKKYK